jgi:knotted carbamoyltransferase YgeW
MKDLDAILDRLAGYRAELHERDFLLTWERTADDLRTILDLAEGLRVLRSRNVATRCFDAGLAVSQFRDNSTRTRFAFASAANLLGLTVQDLDEGKSQIAHGETVRETAVMVAFHSETIGIRDDMYLGAGHEYMREVAAALDQARAEGVLRHRPVVVNLQCDRDHPTQTLADLKHLVQEFGSLDALRGRRIAMTWAHSPSYGKPLSVPQGVIGLVTRLGMEVVLAHPPGYELRPDVTALAAEQAAAAGGSFATTDSLADAFAGADVVYPKSWAPYDVMVRRTELLRAGDRAGLADLEATCLAANARHQDWECTESLMRTTRDGAGLYLHCLPADISGVSCARGEVTSEVFERFRPRLYRQAGWKPYVIAAMILAGRFAEPGMELRRLGARTGRWGGS